MELTGRTDTGQLQKNQFKYNMRTPAEEYAVLASNEHTPFWMSGQVLHAKLADEANRRGAALGFLMCLVHFHGTLQRLP